MREGDGENRNKRKERKQSEGKGRENREEKEGLRDKDGRNLSITAVNILIRSN